MSGFDRRSIKFHRKLIGNSLVGADCGPRSGSIGGRSSFDQGPSGCSISRRAGFRSAVDCERSGLGQGLIWECQCRCKVDRQSIGCWVGCRSDDRGSSIWGRSALVDRSGFKRGSSLRAGTGFDRGSIGYQLAVDQRPIGCRSRFD